MTTSFDLLAVSVILPCWRARALFLQGPLLKYSAANANRPHIVCKLNLDWRKWTKVKNWKVYGNWRQWTGVTLTQRGPELRSRGIWFFFIQQQPLWQNHANRFFRITKWRYQVTSRNMSALCVRLLIWWVIPSLLPLQTLPPPNQNEEWLESWHLDWF